MPVGAYTKAKAGIIGLIVIVISLGCNRTHTERPNILWIVSEDNSPLLGAYGDSLATTPNLDRLAGQGIVYTNAYATTPVCAPSRFTLITGTYANMMGTENMRSRFPLPEFVRFFPEYLRQAGYHTTNNAKKDYNTVDQPEAWDESSNSATYIDRPSGRPFFHVRNMAITHESRLHDPIDTLIHDPNQISIPPYHPDTPRIRRDWAHYYDQITRMDARVGEILDELKQSGEADNTIVFYYSDHGGVLPRSKRFMFESGLRVPLIVYFPPKYAHLAPDQKRVDRLVSFVDFAPTVLSLAGVEPPGYMHGKPFLGAYAASPREYVHAYRGRMDERYDLVRAVRDKEYLYVHNYMPQRIYGQHLNYLWQAPSMQSWHEEYEKGNLTAVQRRFFEPKPVEELYKVSEDPYNINNLASDPDYQHVLLRMRQANTDWMLESQDLGFIPESRIDSLRQGRSLYEAVREKGIPVRHIIETAELASWGREENLDELARRLNHEDSSVRFWAAAGLAATEEKSRPYEKLLLKNVDNSSPAVRLAVAEALYHIGSSEEALRIIMKSLNHPDELVKLRALNLLQVLNKESLSESLSNQIQALIDREGVSGNYVRRASEYLLQK